MVRLPNWEGISVKLCGKIVFFSMPSLGVNGAA